MPKIIWKSEKRKLSELTPTEYNPRQASEKDVKDLTASLERFNVADPLVINKNNQIIGGHFRLKILRDKGISEVDVRVPDRLLTQGEEKELNLRLNKNLGQWDFDALANFDEELLKNVGFDSQELDKIFQLDTKPEDDDIPAERPHTAIMNGDMFKLGEHVLLCGDCTIQENVERLMGGLKADMVFTDPPYGVGFRYNSDEVSLNDTFKYEEYKEFCFKWLDILKTQSDFIVITTGHKNKKLYYEYDNNINELVWIKKNGHSRGYISYYLATEPLVCYGSLPNKRRYDHDYIEVTIKIHKELEGKHSCPKPVELIEAIIEPATDRGMKVLDTFGGSGTTLIACEKLNRKCRMMEIDPIYCQVIIDRWEKYTNGKAKKINV